MNSAGRQDIYQQRHADTFAVLDGLRGVAAIIVMLYHYSIVFAPDRPSWFPQGPLAVDFFFVLSGFIVAHAYEQRLQAGWTLRSFMARRLIRLYPLYWLALTVALIRHTLPALRLEGDDLNWSPLAAYGYGLVFLPAPALPHDNQTLFPLNGPAWSLSLEMAINLAYGFACRYLTALRLTVLTALAALLVAAVMLHYRHIDIGWDWPSYAAGWARVLFSFPAGVLLYRHFRPALRNRFKPATAILLALIMLGLMAWSGTPLALVVGLIVLLPLLVWVGAQTAVSARQQRICNWLGRISYGLYILQLPLVDCFKLGANRLGLDYRSHVPQAILICGLLAVLAITLIDRVFDLPVRRGLTRGLSDLKARLAVLPPVQE